MLRTMHVGSVPASSFVRRPMSLWSRYRGWLRRQNRPDPHVILAVEGVDLVSPVDRTVEASFRWQDVARIQTYKLDLLTTDCICLLFEFRNGKPPVQVSAYFTQAGHRFHSKPGRHFTQAGPLTVMAARRC